MATISKRGETYKITVSAGYDMNGKQLRKHITWTPEAGMTKKQIQKELERQTVFFEEKCKTGQFLDGAMKFSDFAEQWLSDYGEKHLKAKTFVRYKDVLRRVIPALGHIRLDRLQPQHLMQFYDNLAEDNIRTDIKYTATVDLRALIKGKMLIKDFLSLAGISDASLKAAFKGKNVKEKTAASIAAALSLDMNSIFAPVKNKGKLSPSTILYHHRVISSILATAVHWQVLFSNPCDRVKPPKASQKESRYLDEVQVQELLHHLSNEAIQYQAIIVLFIYSGMRRGELCGLNWDAVDTENKIIHIRRNLLYLPEKGIYEDSTKNTSSERAVKLSAEAFKLLLEHKLEQNKIRASVGDIWQESGKVLTRDNGLPLHPDTISGWFHKFIVKNNLPNVTIHSLRHTNASLLIANGINLTTVSKRLGHANTATTTKIYAHAIRSADEIAADTLDDILSPNKRPKQA